MDVRVIAVEYVPGTRFIPEIFAKNFLFFCGNKTAGFDV